MPARRRRRPRGCARLNFTLSAAVDADAHDRTEYGEPSTLLRLGDLNGDVAVLHAAGVIALDVEYSGLRFHGIERAAGGATDFLNVDGLGSIAHEGKAPPDQRDVKRLPSPRRP